MEALKAQIRAQKRQAPAASEPAAKYVRRGDAARSQEPAPPPPPREPTPPPPPKEPTPEPTPEHEPFAISNEDAIARLRQKNEPIRLFGESDKERRLRVRALELIEEHRGDLHGRNDFVRLLQETDEDVTRGHETRTSREQDSGEGAPRTDKLPPSQREGIGMHSLLDLELIRTNTARVYPIIYYTLKGLLNEWGDTLAERPEQERLSTQGRLVTATHAQTREYLKPLFKGLRRRVRPCTHAASRARRAHAHCRNRALHAEARVPHGE